MYVYEDTAYKYIICVWINIQCMYIWLYYPCMFMNKLCFYALNTIKVYTIWMLTFISWTLKLFLFSNISDEYQYGILIRFIYSNQAYFHSTNLLCSFSFMWPPRFFPLVISHDAPRLQRRLGAPAMLFLNTPRDIGPLIPMTELRQH